jgi:hypothetical protein
MELVNRRKEICRYEERDFTRREGKYLEHQRLKVERLDQRKGPRKLLYKNGYPWPVRGIALPLRNVTSLQYLEQSKSKTS